MLRPRCFGPAGRGVQAAKPCYTIGGSNVVIFQPFTCAPLFFKGTLVQDPDGVLKEQGENTRSALRLKFRSVADVTAERTIAALVQDAIREGEPASH